MSLPLSLITSGVLGYELEGIIANLPPTNLPQYMIVLAEANTANQADLTPLDFTSSNDVAQRTGYGSPAHLSAIRMRNPLADTLGAIKTVIIPCEENGTATAGTAGITVAGTATKTSAAIAYINGKAYGFTVIKGDTNVQISDKITAAVTAELNAPCTAVSLTGTSTFTTKWKGTTAKLNLDLEFDAESGITYALVAPVIGTGLADYVTALGKIENNEWSTIVVNCLNDEIAVLDALEVKNGSPESKVANYAATVWKPFVAFTGTDKTLEADLLALTTGRELEATNKFCPSPNLAEFPFEMAAYRAAQIAKTLQSNPHEGYVDTVIGGFRLPANNDIGDFGDLNKRNTLVTGGMSTIAIENGSLVVKDDVTTWAKASEPVTARQFSFVRNLMGIDFNMKYRSALIFQQIAAGKTIQDPAVVGSNSTVTIGAIQASYIQMFKYARADFLITDVDFSIKGDVSLGVLGLIVQPSSANPRRILVSYPYKRTSVVGQGDIIASATYEFGN